jgi:cell division septum initiation protein DivIVA
MSTRIYGPEEKAKLERLINEGQNILREVEDLKEGLKETVKAVAEELEIKPSIINKAITIAHKDNWREHEQAWNDIEMILGVTGRLPKDE